MQIAAIGSVYQPKTNYIQHNFKGVQTNELKSIKILPQSKKVNNNIKNTFLAMLTAFTLLTAPQSCTKEPYGPHPTGYEPAE